MVVLPDNKLLVKGHTAFANLNSSRKDKRHDPPTYERSTWFNVSFVGNAFEKANNFKGGEKIDVISGALTNELNPVTKHYDFKLVVFDFVYSQNHSKEKE